MSVAPFLNLYRKEEEKKTTLILAWSMSLRIGAHPFQRQILAVVMIVVLFIKDISKLAYLQIFGRVSDFIELSSKKYSLAVTRTVGSLWDAIICDSLSVGEEAIKYLTVNEFERNSWISRLFSCINLNHSTLEREERRAIHISQRCQLLWNGHRANFGENIRAIYSPYYFSNFSFLACYYHFSWAMIVS